jgi:hypothetical protein
MHSVSLMTELLKKSDMRTAEVFIQLDKHW